MKKTKLKIFFTNVSRIIMSILFINVALPKFLNASLGPSSDVIIDCYAAGPNATTTETVFNISDVFILLVPLVFIGLLIAFIVYKIKNKNKKGDK